MMYKGYKTYRHYINAKLHGLSIKICGDRTVLDNEIINILNDRRLYTYADVELPPVISTNLLTDGEASNLYRRLINTFRDVQNNVNSAKTIIGTRDEMTVGQRKAIIRIAKYEFRWSPEATFSFILSVFPEKRKRLSSWEIQNSKLLKLYTLISSKDADKIIKRLDQIKKRNLKNNQNAEMA